MHRFFIPPERIDQDRIIITERQAHQLKDVLRLKVGDRIIVLDDSGLEYQVRIVDIKSTATIVEVVERYPCPNEPKIKITLYQALLKGNKFDFTLQKCTEVGIVGFVPIVCQRCVIGNPSRSRINRWQRIIREAAEQSRRGRLPRLHPTVEFIEACEGAKGISLLPWEGEKLMGLKAALREWESDSDATSLNVFVGPEGGFTAQEIEFARRKGIVPISLGKRILRAETAGLVASTAILYEYGDLGDG